MEKDEKLIIYTDGGSRGNPGPAAIGVVVGDPSINSERVKYYSEQIGKTTNNIAEYRAVIFALKKTKSLLGGDRAGETDVEIRSDSELLVSQLNGKYKVKDADLQPLFIEVWNLKQDFKSAKFNLIPREENKMADDLVNRALDTLL
ncbi:ribonuclease HI family protein [Candidatus Jorgensenbacteria bacterium]|nr:ribonuclease HI family protein [Candidatus Jorgensenbacteria bacterium]